MRSSMIAVAVVCVLAGPAGADKVARYEARMAAKYPAVAAARNVGVLNFNGKDGENFTAALVSALQSATLDGAPQFSVKTMESMNFRSADAMSKAEVAAAIRQGQKLDVAVVFTGSTTTVSVTQASFNKQEQVCGGGGIPLLSCKNPRTQNVPCQKVTGQYSVSPRAIRVDTGAVIYSEPVTAKGEYEVCNGQVQDGGNIFDKLPFGKKKEQPAEPAPTTPDALLDKLRRDAAQTVRQQVAPYNRSVTVALKEKAPGLSKGDAAQFAGAMEFAGAGRMDRACSIFATLNTGANAQNVPLLYNLGVCQEVLLPDRPAAALEYYAKADQLLTKPDKLVSDAYLRTKNMVGQSRGLK